MGVCPILFNMLQFWLIDSIVKAKDALNLGSPDPNVIADEEAQAPLFAHEHDSDEEGNGTIHPPRRHRTSRDHERGVSPLKLSPSPPPANDYDEPKPPSLPKTKTSTASHAKTTTNAAGTSALPDYQAIKRRSPPPSPAYGPTEGVPKGQDDDWNTWEDDADWNGEAPVGEVDPLSKSRSRTRTKSPIRSPKTGSRRLSLNRRRSEGNERTAWGMDVISTTTGAPH
jgi:hypothetical protein